MKKRSAKKEKPVKRIFNRMGMTYIELICALALLSLIVVMFTPMLLSSYETLYIAGEKVEEAYDSKVEIEGGLASRNSTIVSNIGMQFILNSQELFENMNVAGRKIASHLQSGLETVFYGVRAKVELLSPDVVYDDTSKHDIVLQTTGLDWDSGDVKIFKQVGGDIEKLKEELGPSQIIIDIVKPDKSAANNSGTSVDSAVYEKGVRADIVENSFVVDPDKKTIALTFEGADFTQSPLKICVYYKNERGVLKTLADYIYIKPAHLMMAGKGTADYFTSAGIEKVDISTGDGENATKQTRYEFNIEGRGMSLDNSTLIEKGPHSSGVTINTIQWVDNDQKGFDPYYVMAGTNGRVYRMYNMNSNLSLKELLGTQNDVNATSDARYNIETGETVHPSFWSGEISDQYNFQTALEAAGYGTTADNKVDCSGTTAKNSIGTRYNYFDTTLRYVMMFSGYTTSYQYQQQASKRISYILTEARDGRSFRLAGKKKSSGDFAGHTGIWEPEPLVFADGSKFNFYTLSNAKEVYDWTPVYLYSGNGTDEEHFDKNFAYLQLKSYTSINPFSLSQSSSEYKDNFYKGDFWYPNSDDGSYNRENNLHQKEPNKDQQWLTKDYANTATITSAAYLPGSGSNGQGQVIYFGYVPAYAYIRQSSDIGKGSNEGGTIVYNTTDSKESRATVYVICGSDGVGSTLYKGYSLDENDARVASDLIRNAGYNDVDNNPNNDTPDAATPTYNPDGFFRLTSRDLGVKDFVYKFTDTELTFTLGYCSRWRMAIGEVTSNGKTEETRSYEKYHINSYCLIDYKNYFNPFPADASGNEAVNTAGAQNLSYHVWFPGEFYNLTETATLDSVTVAVGYTVSGSTYMKESSGLAAGSRMYGTALGSVYNDGVLAAYTNDGDHQYELDSSKGGKTTVFQNLLYYKAHEFITRHNYVTGTGTQEQHARENTRFVKVGIAAETTSNEGSSSGIKRYFAYYADNKANIYRSLVATAEVKFDASSDSAEETVELVDVIKSYPVPDAGTPVDVGVDKPIYGMQPIYLSRYGLAIGQVFSEITAIESRDDLIVITGTPHPASAFGAPYNGVVVGIRDSNNNWTWKVHAMRYSNGEYLTNSTLDSAKIVGNYLYLSGYGNINRDGKNNCWIGAINIDSLKAITDGDPFYIAGYNSSATDDVFMWQNLGESNRIYAIDGYITT